MELDALIREKGLCRMLEKKAEDWAMFWYVIGTRRAIPNTSIEKAIADFLKFSCYRKKQESAVVQYNRMMGEFMEQLRSQ